MQILIGTFTLQVIAILIINGINKVTDILDRRSTPLALEINEQINELEKTKRSSLIKNIEIDNTKYGYINVADKKSTSKPKLKPFKFDLKKLEAITIGYDEPLKEDKPVKVIEGRLVQKKSEALLPKEKSKPIKFIDKVKKTMKSSLPKTVYETKDKVLENDCE